MNCREMVELLCEFLEGELSAEQYRDICQHMDGCPPCVIYFETYRVTIRLSRKLPCEPIPESLALKLQRMLEEHKGERGA
jgi:anti-sigma factor RsiW